MKSFSKAIGYHLIKVFPDIQFIMAHMGGMKYLDAWSGCTWVDKDR